jgi:hypothetical protein
MSVAAPGMRAFYARTHPERKLEIGHSASPLFLSSRRKFLRGAWFNACALAKRCPAAAICSPDCGARAGFTPPGPQGSVGSGQPWFSIAGRDDGCFIDCRRHRLGNLRISRVWFPIARSSEHGRKDGYLPGERKRRERARPTQEPIKGNKDEGDDCGRTSRSREGAGIFRPASRTASRSASPIPKT